MTVSTQYSLECQIQSLREIIIQLETQNKKLKEIIEE